MVRVRACVRVHVRLDNHMHVSAGREICPLRVIV
jgi:hypothetical protein